MTTFGSAAPSEYRQRLRLIPPPGPMFWTPLHVAGWFRRPKWPIAGLFFVRKRVRARLCVTPYWLGKALASQWSF